MATCFFDIDGTIANEGILISEILSTFQSLQDNGHKLFICSGKPYHYIDSIFHGYVDGYIASNGRYLYANQQCILKQSLSEEEMNRYAQVAREHHTLLIFQGAHQHFILSQDKILFDQLEYDDYLRQTNLWQGEEVFNFNAYYQESQTLKELQTLWQDHIILNDHHNNRSADASLCSFDKGDGILKVIHHLNGNLKETYAFGDGSNDLAMFRVCEYCIAMDNAVPSLKDKASYITSHYQAQGVIKALHHYHLL